MNEQKIDFIRAKKFPFGIADLIVFAAAALLVIVLFATLYGKKGSQVEIVSDGGRTVLSLGEDTTLEVDGHLTVVIEDGKCFVSEADCDNHTCMRMGKISRVGETVVCAQNKIVITVIGESDLAGTVGQG